MVARVLCVFFYFLFFFKQKTAYEMRISDWSSDVCSSDLKAAAVLPVFITVDPARDTVEALAGYAEHFHPRLMALTGTEEEVSVAAKSYRTYYQKVEEPGASDYLMDHSSVIYLLGPDGS